MSSSATYGGVAARRIKSVIRDRPAKNMTGDPDAAWIACLKTRYVSGSRLIVMARHKTKRHRTGNGRSKPMRPKNRSANPSTPVPKKKEKEIPSAMVTKWIESFLAREFPIETAHAARPSARKRSNRWSKMAIGPVMSLADLPI